MHVALVHEQDIRYKCDLCEKGFPYRSMLERHKAFHTPVSKTLPLLSHWCSYSFTRNQIHLPQLHKRNPSLKRSLDSVSLQRQKTLNAPFLIVTINFQTLIYYDVTWKVQTTLKMFDRLSCWRKLKKQLKLYILYIPPLLLHHFCRILNYN